MLHFVLACHKMTILLKIQSPDDVKRGVDILAGNEKVEPGTVLQLFVFHSSNHVTTNLFFFKVLSNFTFITQ